MSRRSTSVALIGDVLGYCDVCLRRLPASLLRAEWGSVFCTFCPSPSERQAARRAARHGSKP